MICLNCPHNAREDDFSCSDKCKREILNTVECQECFEKYGFESMCLCVEEN